MDSLEALAAENAVLTGALARERDAHAASLARIAELEARLRQARETVRGYASDDE